MNQTEVGPEVVVGRPIRVLGTWNAEVGLLGHPERPGGSKWRFGSQNPRLCPGSRRNDCWNTLRCAWTEKCKIFYVSKFQGHPIGACRWGPARELTLILALLSLFMGVAAPAACVKGVAVVAPSSMMPDAIPVRSRWFFEPSIPSRERRTVENGRF